MRKRLRMKKAGVSLILSMALFAGIFSGCSQGEENTDTQNTQNTVQEGTTEGNQEAAGEEFVPDPENPLLPKERSPMRFLLLRMISLSETQKENIILLFTPWAGR